MATGATSRQVQRHKENEHNDREDPEHLDPSRSWRIDLSLRTRHIVPLSCSLDLGSRSPFELLAPTVRCQGLRFIDRQHGRHEQYQQGQHGMH